MATPRKSTSGNPATRAAAAAAVDAATAATHEPSSIGSFKKSGSAGKKILRLPSGNNVEVRPLSPETWIAEGMIPDAMAPMINEAISNGKGLPPAKLKKMANDPTMLADAVRMIDAAVVYAVIQPKILPKPAGESDRDDELLYVDEIEMDDKNFIFQWASGGTSDLQRFRREQAAAMGGVQAG